MSRTLIILGALLIVLGLAWPWIQRLGLGQLPGDIVIRRENFVLYLPITSMLLLSLLISAALWFWRR